MTVAGSDITEYMRRHGLRRGKLTIDDVPDDVREKFLAAARRLRGKGFEHYSAEAIVNAIRWHMHIEVGDRDFKVNNNWKPVLSRWAMETAPELRGFFRTRRSKCDDV